MMRPGSRFLNGILIAAAVLILIGSAGGLYLLRQQGEDLARLPRLRAAIDAVDRLDSALRIREARSGAVFGNSQAAGTGAVADTFPAVVLLLEAVRGSAATDSEAAVIERIDSLLAVARALPVSVAPRRGRRLTATAAGDPGAERRALFERVRLAIGELGEGRRQRLADLETRVRERNDTLLTLLAVLVILGGGSALAVAIGGAPHLGRPLFELILRVKGSAGGDLVEKVNIADRAELDHLDSRVRSLLDKVYAINQDLQTTRGMLIRSEKMAALGHISAGIAHEIRNPLAAIKLLLHPLQKSVAGNPDLAEDLRVIAREVDRMERFIQTFLDFARPREPQMRAVPVETVVRDTLDLVASHLANGAIAVRTDFPSPRPLVDADGEQIEQVFVNIVLNAIQAMDQGGTLSVTIATGWDRVAVGRRMVRVAFRDTGPGIAPEVLGTLFDPFVTTRAEGTGLGLSIAHQIVDQHRGWIEAVNNPDGGVTFNVWLPEAAEVQNGADTGSG